MAALAMAARPVRNCEVAVGGAADGGVGNSNGIERTPVLEKRVRTAILDAIDNEEEKLGVRPLLDARKAPTVKGLLKISKKIGLGNDGMLSVGDMAELARIHQLGRYDVKIIDEDLLQNFDSPNDEEWTTSVVHRLMNGQLIAVCYDAGRKGEPIASNGGGTAEWAILCGVIVRTPFNRMDGPSGMRTGRYRKAKDFWRTDRHFQVYPFNDAEHDLDRHHRVNVFGDGISTFFYSDTPSRGDGAGSSNSDTNDDDEDDSRRPPSGTDTESSSDEEQFACTGDACARQAVRKSLNGDANRVWVVARVGRNCDRYAVWSLAQLAASNRQLRTADDEVTAEERAAACMATSYQRSAEARDSDRRATRQETREMATRMLAGDENLQYMWMSDQDKLRSWREAARVVNEVSILAIEFSLRSFMPQTNQLYDENVAARLPPREATAYSRRRLRQILSAEGIDTDFSFRFLHLVTASEQNNGRRNPSRSPKVIWLDPLGPSEQQQERQRGLNVSGRQRLLTWSASVQKETEWQINCCIESHQRYSTSSSDPVFFFPSGPRSDNATVARRYIAFEPIRTVITSPGEKPDPLAAAHVHFTFEKNLTIQELDTSINCRKCKSNP